MKPCPFCGAPASTFTVDVAGWETTYIVKCSGCAARLPNYNKNAAEKAWNKRQEITNE